MAIIPQNEEAFFREVDEELRRDRFQVLVLRWWRWALGAALLALVALALGLAWRAHRQARAGADAEQLSAALAALGTGDDKAADAPLAHVAASPRLAYRALAGITGADMAAGKGDLLGAIARYKLVADDPAVAPPLRDLALVRETTIEYDMLPPAQVIARLSGLARPGGAWFGSAGEMVAMAYLKTGRPAQAGRMFAAIAGDAQAPDTIRARAAQMASGLGVDVSAPAVTAGAGQ